MEKIKNY